MTPRRAGDEEESVTRRVWPPDKYLDVVQKRHKLLRIYTSRGQTLCNLLSFSGHVISLKDPPCTGIDLITKAELRKKELSDQSGVDVATIIRIGNGKATTRVTVVKLVRVLEKYLNRSIDIDSIQGLNITR
jgi:hypothetical protein